MKSRIGLVFILLITIVLSGCSKDKQESPKVIDPAQNFKYFASANVDGEKITKEEFARKFLQVKLAVAKNNNLKFDEHVVKLLGEKTMEGMIEAKLIEKELERLKIKPTLENVNKFVNETKKDFKNETAFNDTLKELNMTEQDFLQDCKKELYENTYRQYLASTIKEKDNEKKNLAANQLFNESLGELKKKVKIERKVEAE